MKKLELDKYYSLLEASKFLKLTRQSMVEYISKYKNQLWSVGKLVIIQTSGGSTRYQISGQWIKDFNNRYEKGLFKLPIKNEKDKIFFTIDEFRIFCEKNKIQTIKEFINRFK